MLQFNNPHDSVDLASIFDSNNNNNQYLDVQPLNDSFNLSYHLHDLLTSKLKDCQYFTPSNLPLNRDKQRLFMLHVNIRSLNKNFDDLNHDLLHFFFYSPDIICLSETKLKGLPLTNIHLSGYQFILHANSSTYAGGVGIYITDKFTFCLLESNTLHTSCDDLWVHITDRRFGETFILGVIYRHPKGDINSFLSTLNNKLLQINPNQKLYITGDLNLNTGTNSNSQHKSSFFNTINSNGVYSLINKPTRLSRSSSSTIDHILTNDTSNVILPCIILHDLTDHFPIACIIENRSFTKVKNKKANSLSKCIYKDFFYFDTDLFLNDLHFSLLPLLNNQSCLSAVNVDHKFNIFIETFNKCVNKHVPLKTASRKKIRLMRKPWITKEIFTSIRHKQKMYIPYYVRGTEIQKMIYQQYSNKLTKIKTLSKKQYINSEINNTNNNMRKFWSLINTIIPGKPKQSLPNFLNINNTKINDPIQIAEYFNNHFSTIGKTLANKLASTSSTDFTTYLSN